MDLYKLNSSTFTSDPITHSRLKSLSKLAQSTEDHISRIGLALSLRRGALEGGWTPTKGDGEIDQVGPFPEKHLKGKTLFKDEIEMWLAMILHHQSPKDYADWRSVIVSHWERGVQELFEIASLEGDWIRTLKSCLPE